MNNLDPLAYENPNLMIGNEEKSRIIIPPVILKSANHCSNLSYYLELDVDSSFYSFNEKDKNLVTQSSLYNIVQFYGNTYPSSWDHCRKALADRLNKKTASEIIHFLPLLFHQKIPVERLKIENFYMGYSSWLVHWDDNLNTSSLKKSSWNWIEGFAVVAKRRYELIYELFNKKLVEKNTFLTPEYSWLISQTSILRQQIVSSFRSREELYQNNKQYINQLDLTYEEKVRTFKCDDGNNDLLTYANKYFDYLGRETAVKDTDFDRYYFQPYVIASRRWNTYTRKNLELVLANGQKLSKPGRKLGQINR